MVVTRTWTSKNQGEREYRKIVGPVSKEKAEQAKRKAGKQGYYARISPYKGEWAAWTTQPVPWSSKENKGARKYTPRAGTFFKRGHLRPIMEKAGWIYEGSGGSKAYGDVAFIDKSRNLWLWLYYVPYRDGVKIVKVERKRLD